MLCETLAEFGAWQRPWAVHPLGTGIWLSSSCPSPQAQAVRREPEWGSEARTKPVARLGLLPWPMSPHRYKGNAGVAQGQVYLACEGHSFLGVDTEDTREGAPQGGG